MDRHIGPELTRLQRSQIKDRFYADKIRMEQDGTYSVHTHRARGDGGLVPWWMHVGSYQDLINQGIITE